MPNVRNSLEVFLSYCVHKNGTNIWTIGQEGILMPLAMATAGIKNKKNTAGAAVKK